MFILYCLLGAQPARIEATEARLRKSPDSKGDIIQFVKKNTPLAVSNVPTNGFYKARLKNGTIGWIDENEIRVFPDQIARKVSSDIPKDNKINETPFYRFGVDFKGGVRLLGLDGLDTLFKNSTSFFLLPLMELEISFFVTNFLFVGLKSGFTFKSLISSNPLMSSALFFEIPSFVGTGLSVGADFFKFEPNIWIGSTVSKISIISNSAEISTMRAMFSGLGSLRFRFIFNSHLSLFIEGGSRFNIQYLNLNNGASSTYDVTNLNLSTLSVFGLGGVGIRF